MSNIIWLGEILSSRILMMSGVGSCLPNWWEESGASPDERIIRILLFGFCVFAKSNIAWLTECKSCLPNFLDVLSTSGIFLLSFGAPVFPCHGYVHHALFQDKSCIWYMYIHDHVGVCIYVYMCDCRQPVYWLRWWYRQTLVLARRFRWLSQRVILAHPAQYRYCGRYMFWIGNEIKL